jgi:hypothetical protein
MPMTSENQCKALYTSTKYFTGIHSLFKNSPCNDLPGKPLLLLEDLNKKFSNKINNKL